MGWKYHLVWRGFLVAFEAACGEHGRCRGFAGGYGLGVWRSRERLPLVLQDCALVCDIEWSYDGSA